jgi:hypothetical protein
MEGWSTTNSIVRALLTVKLSEVNSVEATRVRSSGVCLLGLVLAIGGASRASMADEPAGWPQAGEMTYVSEGLNFDHDWGTFVLHPGNRGRAIYTKKGEPIREVRLQFAGVFPSSTHPHVLFAVYRESAPNPATNKVRQWAFQVDFRTLNGYVIYVKDTENNAWDSGWAIYDFGEKNPE